MYGDKPYVTEYDILSCNDIELPMFLSGNIKGKSVTAIAEVRSDARDMTLCRHHSVSASVTSSFMRYLSKLSMGLEEAGMAASTLRITLGSFSLGTGTVDPVADDGVDVDE